MNYKPPETGAEPVRFTQTITIRPLCEARSFHSSAYWRFQSECGTMGRLGDLDRGFCGARQLSIIATCCTHDTVQ
jgi:hypothetical protein